MSIKKQLLGKNINIINSVILCLGLSTLVSTIIYLKALIIEYYGTITMIIFINVA